MRRCCVSYLFEEACSVHMDLMYALSANVRTLHFVFCFPVMSFMWLMPSDAPL